ncbi:iron chelate uptake ABC transporter family permease subunit [Amycolatopsis acidicola]|uniref:Iron chelate uptake ABC transporter family permease subunit n=1 Tax=Amycolatopsis acidicola TaxID=2596893 RepID=A0A5N0UZ13_9PSEU|nr:iron chelate uptake ABC transporter family permease subunit [Amycolatopsis acidicola]KAA9158731.1 iron chelate uptake ABC transporter family permease subunit [Amycolatopsis acidicola]
MTAAEQVETGRAVRRGHALRAGGLVLALAALVLVALVSVAVGAKSIGPGTVVDALLHNTGTPDEIVIRSLRVPRTLLGICVGAALGLAGVLMQGLTRNPLADPGLLGINSGAAAAIVVGISFFGLGSASEYVWFGLLGAAVAAVVVYLLGSGGSGGATPVRLVLAGTAVAAALLAFVQAMLLVSPTTFDQFRFWQLGSLAGRDLNVLGSVVPFLALGALIAFTLARPLNAVVLGDDAGRALGAHLGRTRAWGALAITLLCGAATAAAGPLTFIGLAMPYVARAIVGPDHRWLLPYAAVLSPILLLAADILGRVIAPPGELAVGLVVAFVGAPVFIALVLRRKVAAA